MWSKLTIFLLVANFVAFANSWTQIKTDGLSVISLVQIFDTLIAFPKERFEKVNFRKKNSTDNEIILSNHPACKELKTIIDK